MSQRELKLEVGKKYKNRRGQTTKIINWYQYGDELVFTGLNEVKNMEYSYRENGVYNSCVETYFDLIEEVNE